MFLKRKMTNAERISKENNLRYSIVSNILETKQEHEKVRSVLHILADTVARTLGPYGSSTVLQDTARDHVMSKDGYDLMNRIRFNGDFETMVLDIVRKVSANQVQRVGDGTTSSIIVANALCDMLTDKKTAKLFKNVSPRDVLAILDCISQHVITEIKLMANPVDVGSELLAKIATISLNNDSETGKFVADAYKEIGKFGFLSTEIMKRRATTDELEIKNGFEIERGYISRIFGEGLVEKKVDIENSRVFISMEGLGKESIPVLTNVMEETLSRQEHLLIIAPSYDDNVRSFLEINRENNRKKTGLIAFTPVDVATASFNDMETLRDIAAFCGCSIYMENPSIPVSKWLLESKTTLIGRVERIVVSDSKTMIIGCREENKENVKARAEKIKAELEELELKDEQEGFSDFTTFLLKKRYANLTTGTAIVHIGGRNHEERKSRERLVEDAILACKSALRDGYIEGGNLVIPRLLLNPESRAAIMDKFCEDFYYIPDYKGTIDKLIVLVGKAFLRSYEQVLVNASYLSRKEIKDILAKCVSDRVIYNVKTHKFESSDETSIINPSGTDIQILTSTISIIGMLALSNQAILTNLIANGVNE